MGQWRSTVEGLAVNAEFWRDRKVLVTGHTGFKGAWLVAWLHKLGSDVTGLSLAPEGDPNLWSLLTLDGSVRHVVGDIRDSAAVNSVLQHDPEIVIHLAAQALVRKSYSDPVDTFATNVTGTVQLLHSIAQTPSVRSVIVATSDKVYQNLEDGKPFVETDRLGGTDPYSASKGACEIAVQAMRESFFNSTETAQIATVRAGNVIGGGDWSEDRLVPDIIRGCLSGQGIVTLRAPASIRPWQHVLEPLGGYITLAERLFDNPTEYCNSVNFGPAYGEEREVHSVAEGIVAKLGRGQIVHDCNPNALKESKTLRLDSVFASEHLGWRPVLDFDESLAMTADWYADWFDGANIYSITVKQIEHYMQQMTST